MTFRTLLTAAAVGLATVTFAFAADDIHEQRETAMKAIGGSMGTMAKMVKGEADFDQAEVKAALEKIAASIETFPTYFPDGSQNADSEAAPAIWENKADFEAKAMKLKEDASALAANPPADVDALKAAIGPLGQNCASCHETYRIKKS